MAAGVGTSRHSDSQRSHNPASMRERLPKITGPGTEGTHLPSLAFIYLTTLKLVGPPSEQPGAAGSGFPRARMLEQEFERWHVGKKVMNNIKEGPARDPRTAQGPHHDQRYGEVSLRRSRSPQATSMTRRRSVPLLTPCPLGIAPNSSWSRGPAVLALTCGAWQTGLTWSRSLPWRRPDGESVRPLQPALCSGV